MTYKKNPRTTYVAMCKYFDEHIYDADRDDNLLYQYLYHICYMLACKARYFKDMDEYDDFALYISSKLYMKYPIPTESNVRDGKIMIEDDKRLISILNYTKSVLYPMKVNYQREFYAQVFMYENVGDGDKIIEEMKVSIQKDYADELEESVIESLHFVPNIIKKTINETPYKNDKLMCKRLYMSCLLSIVNGMTLSNSTKNKIAKRSDINEREELFIKSLQQERQKQIILWHLDETLKDYIRMLVNKIRKDLYRDITQTKNQFSLTDKELDGIMLSAFAYGNNYEEDY